MPAIKRKPPLQKHRMAEKLVERVHRRQAVRHVVANKLQLALIVLRELEDKRAVPPELVRRAIADLDAIVEWLDKARRPEKRL